MAVARAAAEVRVRVNEARGVSRMGKVNEGVQSSLAVAPLGLRCRPRACASVCGRREGEEGRLVDGDAGAGGGGVRRGGGRRRGR